MECMISMHTVKIKAHTHTQCCETKVETFKVVLILVNTQGANHCSSTLPSAIVPNYCAQNMPLLSNVLYALLNHSSHLFRQEQRYR